MKIIAILVLLFSCLDLFAGGNPELNFSEYLGAKPTEDQLLNAIRVFLSDTRDDIDYDYTEGTLFDYLVDNELWEELLFSIGYIKAVSGSFPNYPKGYFIFNNPICLVYASEKIEKAKKASIIKRIIELDGRYLNWPSTDGMGYSSFPILDAIRYDDPEMVEYFISSGDYLYNRSDIIPYKIAALDWPVNTLSLSRSKEVRAVLIKFGVEETYDFPKPIDGWCEEDRVRIRKVPGLSGEIIGYLYKKEKLQIFSSMYTREIINGLTGCWVLIDNGRQRGWVFSPYIYSPTIHEP